MSGFKINNVDIADPTEFNAIPFNVEKKDRLANGRLVKDVIATKIKFEIKWNLIRWNDLKVIADAIALSSFFVLTYIEGGETKTATVETSEYSKNLQRATGETFLYKDFSLTLEEQ